MDARRPLDHTPQDWAGHHVVADRAQEIDVIAHVQWSDGTCGEVEGTASEWTRTHVCVRLSGMNRLWVRAEQVHRRG
jgi:hypothetical protein